MQTKQIDLDNLKILAKKSVAMKTEINNLRNSLQQAQNQVEQLTKNILANEQNYEIKVNSLLASHQENLQTLQNSLMKTHKQQIDELSINLDKSKTEFDKIEKQLKDELNITKQTNQFILSRVRS